MLSTHIYLNGQCKESIEAYVKAFKATVQTIVLSPAHEELVLHAEILIHGQLLYLNDFGDGDGFSKSGGYQLAIRFDSEEELKEAYAVLSAGSTTISPPQATEYSVCQVRFVDRFDVRWAFWV